MKYPSFKPLDFFASEENSWIYLLINHRGISLPSRTVDYLHPACVPHPRENIDTFVDLEQKGIFNVSRLKMPGMANGFLYFIPDKKIEGLHCLTCIENTTCSLQAISANGLSYHATSNHLGFVEEWSSVKSRIDQFINNHVAN